MSLTSSIYATLIARYLYQGYSRDTCNFGKYSIRCRL